MTSGCSEHRDVQILLALRRRLAQEDLNEQEKEALEVEISRLEEELGIS
ncbi:MAG: hypothetical protein JRG97_06110 [Deltaproteobacteria bacterium]|nr:hypothetical protein [Deltaproteobacteria bacterium]MBW2140631.1 hypothetical protein [Deltaproteobacteria bacterium]MBW2323306.1 hypothetical protein [Deltaproteobacteria bacterium]